MAVRSMAVGGTMGHHHPRMLHIVVVGVCKGGW